MTKREKLLVLVAVGSFLLVGVAWAGGPARLGALLPGASVASSAPTPQPDPLGRTLAAWREAGFKESVVRKLTSPDDAAILLDQDRMRRLWRSRSLPAEMTYVEMPALCSGDESTARWAYCGAVIVQGDPTLVQGVLAGPATTRIGDALNTRWQNGLCVVSDDGRTGLFLRYRSTESLTAERMARIFLRATS